MLTRKEKYIMEYLYQRCTGKTSCLINPREIITFASDRYIMYPPEVERIVTNLVYDNYIDMAKSDKKGEMVYCVSLKLKGQGFHRELVNNKRTTAYYLGRAVVLAIVSFIVTCLLKFIFF